MIKFLKKSIKILCICLLINFIFSCFFPFSVYIKDIKEAINNVNQAKSYAFESLNIQAKIENNISYKYGGLIYHFNEDKMLVKVCSTSCYSKCYDYNGTFHYILDWYVNTAIIEIVIIYTYITLHIILPCFVIFFLITLLIKLFISKFF